ncbi:MAG: hypothetical protein EBU46_14565 [Nitrosomonadaceae bacterium]|nr:hypothetical protein [Nitrosomonadaceae bacterium]
MSTQTIRVVAHLIARTDKIPEVQAILQGIVAPTRQEAGCLSYQLFSNDGNPVEFFVYRRMDRRKCHRRTLRHAAYPKCPDRNNTPAHASTGHPETHLTGLTSLFSQITLRRNRQWLQPKMCAFP